MRVTVRVQSLQSGQHNQLVVVNILDANENAIYDSNVVGENIDFVLGYRDKMEVGPFTITIPRNAPRGTYTVLAGYREYPWEPLIAFRGATWAPPVKKIRIK